MTNVVFTGFVTQFICVIQIQRFDKLNLLNFGWGMFQTHYLWIEGCYGLYFFITAQISQPL